MPRRLAIVAAPLLLAALLLSGCTPEPRIPAAEPQPTATPLFASDEEALAAATAAYEEYLAVLDGLLQDPRPVTDQFDMVATSSARDAAVLSVQEFVDDGIRTTGPRALGASTFQSSAIGIDQAEVTAYFCEDISAVDVVDRSGNVLSTPERPNFSLWEATVVLTPSTALLTSREFWSNEDAC